MVRVRAFREGKKTGSKTKFFSPFLRFRIRETVGIKCEIPRSGDGVVELSEASRCGISGVGEYFFACFHTLAIDSQEFGNRKHDFSTDLYFLGFERDRPRDALDLEGVDGHVLSLDSVSASEGSDQLSVTVRERESETVELQFHSVFERRVRMYLPVFLSEHIPYSPLEIGYVVLIVGIVERYHLGGVESFLKLGRDEHVDAFCRRSRIPYPISLFQSLERMEKSIVLPIRYDRRLFGIIELIVFSENILEFRDIRFGERIDPGEERNGTSHELRCLHHDEEVWRDKFRPDNTENPGEIKSRVL